MPALKNPKAFMNTDRREFVICARLNGYTVVMEAKPGHHDAFNCDRVAVHIGVFNDEEGVTRVGIKGANKVTPSGDPGDEINLEDVSPALEALRDPYYGNKIDSLVLAFIEEVGGQEEIHIWLRETGRDEDPIVSMLRALGIN